VRPPRLKAKIACLEALLADARAKLQPLNRTNTNDQSDPVSFSGNLGGAQKFA
jgi:hypothetical protein